MKTIENDLSKELDLTDEEILNAYKAYWRFIHDKAGSIDFQNIKSKDEFEKIKTSFNIPNLGKLYSTWYLCKKINKKKKSC